MFNPVDVLRPSDRKRQFLTIGSWCLYDYANTIFAFAVMGFYFNQWLCLDLGVHEVFYAVAIGVAMIAVGISTPIIGVISDRRRQRARFVNIFTVACCLFTAAMGFMDFVLSGRIPLAALGLILFALANYCYAACLSFYNALMPVITTPKNIGRVSGAGVALGYLGAVIGGAVAYCFVEGEAYWWLPGWVRSAMDPFMIRSFDPSMVDQRIFLNAFVPTALYYFLFSLPFFFFVQDKNPEPDAARLDWNTSVEAFSQVVRNLKETRKYPGVLRFLGAKSLYEDALQTTILFMPLYAEHAIGMTDHTLKLVFMGTTSIFATIGSFVAGVFVDRLGPKRTLMGVVFGWVFFMTLTAMWPSEIVFWVVGCCLGALLGSAWTAARPLLSELTPPSMSSEFFGLYALSGKVATIVGPGVFAGTIYIVGLFTGPLGMGRGIEYRAGVLALAAMVGAGFWVLRKVPDYFKDGRPDWDRIEAEAQD